MSPEYNIGLLPFLQRIRPIHDNSPIVVVERPENKTVCNVKLNDDVIKPIGEVRRPIKDYVYSEFWV